MSLHAISCLFFLSAGVLCSPLHTASVSAADVVVVVNPDWEPALQPWITMRSAEGLSIAIARPANSPTETHQAIWNAGEADTRYIFLVGDTPDFDTRRDQPHEIPTWMLPAPVTSRYGSTTTLPSDLPYGDRDNDKINDAAVGRLPVRTSEQLINLVTRIEAYETSNDFGLWRRSFQLTGGVGGFGAMVDTAIESITRGVITTVLPADAKPQIAYASPNHPFYPSGGSFTDAVMQRYRSGARFWVYAGHGQIDRLELLKTTDADGSPTDRAQWSVEAFLDNQNASLLQRSPSGASIAVLLACFAGAYDAPGDCLAERMLLANGGPIAVIASSRLSMPYGNACMGLGLLQSVYAGGDQNTGCSRIGDAMLHAAQTMQSQQAAQRSSMRIMVDSLASMLSPDGNDLKQERLEHAALYQLLGDPTLRLHPPQPLELQVDSSNSQQTASQEAPTPDRQTPSKKTRTISIAVTSPIAGTLIVAVDRPLTAITEAPSGATPDHDAHGTTITEQKLEVSAGQRVLQTLTLPLGESGPLIIRGFVHGKTGWASAAQRTSLPD
ncbi:C25 family cysteine peptidase [Rhodopirellula halodulae]|uniref:C25 family cysteine peptidase n=1 Tax=Rhodopirellula halodulae TaxID=2894198 RepID=UPI001E5CEA9F|nr:C25 family cysteine peptidase [Rhodopirellula sp. JC737]MCC9657302.1 C25 family cysteine peptidase [Rhodopirellula sp. JC737]